MFYVSELAIHKFIQFQYSKHFSYNYFEFANTEAVK